ERRAREIMDLVVPVEGEDAIARSRQIESGAEIREGGFQACFVDRGDGDDVRKPRRIIQGPGARVSGRGDDESPPRPCVVDCKLDVRWSPERLVRAQREIDYLRTVLGGPADCLGRVEGRSLAVQPAGPEGHHFDRVGPRYGLSVRGGGR